MRALNATELATLSGMGKGRFTKIYAEIMKLEINQGLAIEKGDWKTQGAPYRIVRNVAKNTGRTFDYGRMPDGSGWYVKRNA